MSVKSELRAYAAKILFRSGITLPKWRGRNRLTIVTFHRVLPEEIRNNYPYPGLAVTPEELDGFLSFFESHFECGTLEAQHECFVGGGTGPRPLLALTFDDAQFDNYLHARPVLSRHGLKATFFAPVEAIQRRDLLWHDRLGFSIGSLRERGSEGTRKLEQLLGAAGIALGGVYNLPGRVVRACKRLAPEARLRLVEILEKESGSAGGPDFARLMTFEELAVLEREGHEIGSHSMSHRMMPECDDRELDYELGESKRVLEQHLRRNIGSFCYPNGNCDVRTARAAAQAGYRRAVTTVWGCNDLTTDPWQLHRFDMECSRVRDSYGRLLPALIAFRMSGFYPGMGRT